MEGYAPSNCSSYDGVGNPANWRGNLNTLTWTGRELTGITMPSSQTMSYKYNADGIRTQKTFTDNAVKYYYKHDYILDGAKVVAETITYFTYFGTNTTETLYYYYDESGAPTGIKYNNNVYYFQKNLQGDIIRILNSYGSIVATYTYDAWGNIIASTDTSGVSIGTKNPFRYRGYYYDTETGLYYVSSRYYDPEIGRWINADALVDQSSVLGYNLFAYCRNNPVNMTDTTGNLPFFAITAAIGAVVGAVVGGVVAAKNGGNVWAGIGIGAAAGALIGTGAGMAAGAALAGSITATTGAVMAGGSTLVATVGTGGLGAGATYIANNLSQAANNLAPAAQTAASKMQEVATKGKAGEALSGLAKNTSHIPSLTGTASYRIPDGLDAGMRILSEVKNYSGTLSYTNQLKDFVMWSQANGYQMHLYTNATLTGPLQQVVDSGIIQLFPLG